jgi:GNAT superfamily N-acetyltransferase
LAGDRNDSSTSPPPQAGDHYPGERHSGDHGPMILIRLATTADVPDLVACHLACWQEAYRDIVPAAHLAGLERSVPARIDYWTTKITEGERPWIAVDGDAVVGFAAAGPTSDEDRPPGLELFAIYVRAAYWNTGLGHRLLESAIADHPASLWVLQANPRALRFYRSHGFTEDGTSKTHARLQLPIIRMTR